MSKQKRVLLLAVCIAALVFILVFKTHRRLYPPTSTIPANCPQDTGCLGGR